MAGAGVYTYQLVRALAGVTYRHHLTVLSRPGLFEDLATGYEHVEIVTVEPRSPARRLVWEQTALPLLLRRLQIDVLHSPHHHTPAWPRIGGLRSLRRVVTFHDVTFLLMAERYPLSRRLYMEAVTRASARLADGIIVPSRAVRDDVMRRLGVSKERIVVIPEAPAARYRPAEAGEIARVRRKYGLPQRFILSVGSLEPGKNRRRLLHALRGARASGFDYALAIAGQPAWRHEDEPALAERLGIADAVRFLGYVPDEDMPALYSGATLLAFPSLYEGFGLPVLEAMACGTPVLTSQGSATEEVAGGAAALADPRSQSSIEGALVRLLADDGERSRLRDLGLERAAQFSWERTARDTLSVYEVVAALSR